MLSTLLRPAKHKESRDFFSLYVIAASFEKMRYRLTNARLSVPYHDCLKNLKSFAFPEVVRKAGDGKSLERDDAFASAIPAMAKLVYNESPALEIPNLRHHHAAKLSQPIYNKNTCLEFHLLLCKLLKGFEDSLSCLQALQASAERDSAKTYKALNRVNAFGSYLRIMVRSFAIEAHLEAIAHLLVVDTRKTWMPEPEEDAEADFSDFQRLKPYSLRKGVPLLPWQSYRDWLKLIVHYFDAGHVLTKYVCSLGLDHRDSSWDITISILTPPLPDKTMITWIELLSSELFFPTPPGGSSGTDLIDFLSKACVQDKSSMVNGILASARALLESLDSNPLGNLDDQIDALALQVTESTLDDLALLGQEILALKDRLQPQDRQAEMQVIVDTLKTLSDREAFFKNLRDGGLHQGSRFVGVYHCEASIASLLTFCRQFPEHDADTEDSGPSEPDTIRIKALLANVKVSQAFLHRLNPC